LDFIVTGIFWYVAFVFCVTLHEAAHAWTAKLGGDLTAYYGGQVSIDPIPHIRRELIGMVVLPLISVFLMGWPFGYASAPYDPYWAQRYPRRAALMALAGPVSNLLTAVVAGIFIHAGYRYGIFESPVHPDYAAVVVTSREGMWPAVAMLLSMLFSLGLILAVFNLIPVPPLDGSGILPLFLNNELTFKYRQLMHHPMFTWIGIIIAWNLFDPLFRPIFMLALSLLYPDVTYR